MKRSILVIKITVLLLALLASIGCGISRDVLRATMLTEVVATREVAFRSVHGQYVTAMGEDDAWTLGQKTEPGPCGWFTLHHLANGKVALVACHDRYVTSPGSGNERKDWLIKQEAELSDCGQFYLYELGNDLVALKTCAGRFFTPGDHTWEPGLEWRVVAETDYVDAWEKFTVLQP